MRDAAIDAGCLHVDEHLAWLWGRPVDLLEMDEIR